MECVSICSKRHMDMLRKLKEVLRQDTEEDVVKYLIESAYEVFTR